MLLGVKIIHHLGCPSALKPRTSLHEGNLVCSIIVCITHLKEDGELVAENVAVEASWSLSIKQINLLPSCGPWSSASWPDGVQNGR